MQCPACGRSTPDALLVCKHCGASTRTPWWRRLFGRLRAPRVGVSLDVSAERARPDEEPLGIEMPAGAAVKMTVSDVTVTRSGTEGLDALPPDVRDDVRDALRRAAGSGGMVYYEKVVSDDGSGPVVSERGTPPDPQVRAALQKLLATEATTQREIVVDVNGERQVYRSVDEMPPEVRKLLGQFADLPVTHDRTDS